MHTVTIAKSSAFLNLGIQPCPYHTLRSHNFTNNGWIYDLIE